MAEALRVAVRRGEFVECIHEVHAVAIRDGDVVVSAGDPELVASLRSSAKPLQALPLARAYPGLGEEELAALVTRDSMIGVSRPALPA